MKMAEVCYWVNHYNLGFSALSNNTKECVREALEVDLQEHEDACTVNYTDWIPCEDIIVYAIEMGEK